MSNEQRKACDSKPERTPLPKCDECGGLLCPQCDPCCVCGGTGWVKLGREHKQQPVRLPESAAPPTGEQRMSLDAFCDAYFGTTSPIKGPFGLTVLKEFAAAYAAHRCAELEREREWVRRNECALS